MPMRACDGSGFLPKCRTCYVVRNPSGEEREATAAELRELGGGWEKVFKYKGGRELTKRQAEEAGLHPTKDRASSTPVKRKLATTDWDTKETFETWRQTWEAMCNEALEAHGSDKRVDRRSNAERGIDLIPTVHEGPSVTAMERRAEREARGQGREYEPVTEVRRRNVLIREINERIRAIMEQIKAILMTRLEQARTQQGKRNAQRTYVRRRPRAKKPYAPQRGRRVSPRGGYGR